jgi:enamine deaminase RidA (YjgF/YER057c/UK114 family)
MDGEMKRKAVNPWAWSLRYGFNQGELVEGQSRVLYCAGQAAIDAEGKPQHEDDIRAQTTMALDNLEAILHEAGMTLSNVVRLIIYTTEPDIMARNFAVLSERLGAAGAIPVQTFLGVSRLAFPELLVELEATAVA